jgi:PEP-CTERM motif
LTLAAALLAGPVTEANASNTLFQQFVGDYGVATAGWGNYPGDSGTISVNVPVGSTVTGAWLYSSTYSQPDTGTPGGTLGGTIVNYSTALGVNPTVPSLEAFRSDVSSIVAPVINGGPGGTYNFSISETNTQFQDGEALVVVYSNPALPNQTIGILDGASSSTGDSTSITFAKPLDPTAPGFFAHMAIGDGFSCCGQASEIDVNGSAMTTVAGNDDSCIGSADTNGCLITVGNINGPYTGGTPGSPQIDYSADHEAYDLSSFISKGDSTIDINTKNPSLDDLIFLQVFDVSGLGTVIGPTVPEPSTWAMMLVGFAGLGFVGYRTSKKQNAALAAG